MTKEMIKRRETKRRALSRTINGGKSLHPIITRYTWYKLKKCGSFVYSDGREENIEELDIQKFKKIL